MISFALSPLVSLAVSMVPGLARRVADHVLPGVEGKITKVVTEFLGTADPDVAEAKIRDPKVASELRLRLAEIEVEASKVEAEARERERQAQLDAMKLELRAFTKQIEDGQNARAAMSRLVQEGSVFAWGPVALSCIVAAGFFVVLFLLIELDMDVNATNQQVWQVINIAIGALTAGFATVISFWLGSSQGSRLKDNTALAAQSAVADLQRNSAEATQKLVENQFQQTESLVTRLAKSQAPQFVGAARAAPAPSSGASGRKDPRQFHNCVSLIMRHEGGYSNNPVDRGGPTNMGVTHKTLAAWRKIDEVTSDEVEKLSMDEAKAIYRANYWNALNCDQLPPGVDLVVFDFGVNAGPSKAAKMLQKALAVAPDGMVGQITVGAARISDAPFVIATFSDERLRYYQSLPDWPVFGEGWTRRTADIREAALDMARAARG